MVVCMSRRICVDLHREIVALRPEWHDDADDIGKIKVVMTGSASDYARKEGGLYRVVPRDHTWYNSANGGTP